MRTRSFAGPMMALALCLAGCSRNNIEAVNRSIEGDQARKAGDTDSAISKYEQAEQLDPTNHRIMWKLATAYQKKEDWSKVASTMARAEKVAPKFAEYYQLHGIALARQAVKGPTSWADAKGPLQQAIQEDPNLADSYFELAEVQLHLDDEQGALQSYSKAIEVRPDNTAFYGPLADLYLRRDRLDEAEKVLKEGLSFAKEGDKHTFELHSFLGSIYETRGNNAGALTEYELARKSCGQCMEPGQPIAFFNLGAAYAANNQKNQACGPLQSFNKMVCKGAAAQRYADQCGQTQAIGAKLGCAFQ